MIYSSACEYAIRAAAYLVTARLLRSARGTTLGDMAAALERKRNRGGRS